MVAAPTDLLLVVTAVRHHASSSQTHNRTDSKLDDASARPAGYITDEPAAASTSADTSAANSSLFSAIKEEFSKLYRFIAHDVGKTAKQSAESVKDYADTMTDRNLSEEEREKRRKKEEAYKIIMARNAQKAQEEAAAKTANMSWSEKLKYNLEQMKKATSKEQGVAALVQHCAAAHQAEVAVEQGIDVENIQIVLEQVKTQDGIGYETKVVGYIDAPKASEEQVYQFAERLKQKCPAANMMQASMDWRKKGGHEDPNALPNKTIDGDDSSYDTRSRFASSDPTPSSLSGRDYMNQMESDGSTSNMPGTASAGGFGTGAANSTSAFPSSFKNRKSTSRVDASSYMYDNSDHHAKVHKGTFDNPFAKLNIPKKSDGNNEPPKP